MLVTLPGMVAEVKVLQFETAPSPIAVTLNPSIVSGKVKSLSLPVYLVIVAVTPSSLISYSKSSVALVDDTNAIDRINDKIIAKQINAGMNFLMFFMFFFLSYKVEI